MGDILAQVLTWIMSIFIALFGDLLLFLVEQLIEIATYNSFVSSTAVVNGWVIVRDLCNMFFVVVLLAIAVATILKIEMYHYKKLLGRLVIMAIVINFSKTIAGIIIDFSQVLTLTFVNGFKAAAGGNFALALGLDKIMALEPGREDITAWQVAGSYALALIMIIVSCVVVGVMLAVFLIRMVMLWILIVLSPLAFFLTTFPQGQKYASQWWSQFGNYVLVGPVMAFFLWLSLISVSTLGPNDRPEPLGGSAELQKIGITEIGGKDSMQAFIIAIGMLIGSLTITQQMGIMGSSLAGSAVAGVKKFGMGAIKKPLGVAWRGVKAPIKAGAGYIGQKYNETAPGWANPVAVYRGLKKRREEDKKDAQELALTRGRGAADRLMTWGKVRIPYEDNLRRTQEASFSKDYSKMNKEQKAASLARIWGKKGSEYEDRRRSLLMSMAVEGHIDDALSTDFFRQQYGDTIDQKTVHRFLKDGCGTDSQGLRAAFDIGEAGKKINHYEYAGVAKYDITKDDWAERGTAKEASDYAHSEINKMATRDQLKIHPHNFSSLKYDPTLGTHVWAEGGDYENGNWERIFGSMKDVQEIQRYTPARLADMFGKFDTNSRLFTVTDTMMGGIQKKWEVNPLAVHALFDKVGGQGITYRGTQYADFAALAAAQGWTARPGAPQPQRPGGAAAGGAAAARGAAAAGAVAAAGGPAAPGGTPPTPTPAPPRPRGYRPPAPGGTPPPGTPPSPPPPTPAPGGAPVPPAPTSPTAPAPSAPSFDTAALEHVMNNFVSEIRNFSGKVNFDDLKQSMSDLRTGVGQAASEFTRGNATLSSTLGGAVKGLQTMVDKMSQNQRRMDEMSKRIGARKAKKKT